MIIFDAQVHVWRGEHDPVYPWAQGHPTTFFETGVAPHATETVIADMDAAGVDAALAVVPGLYGWDNRYAIDSARRFPDRLRVVARIDWKAPDHEARLAHLVADPMVVGIRITERHNLDAWNPEGVIEPMLAAAEKLGVVLFGSPGSRNLPLWATVARRHPRLVMVVDHLGMEAPPVTVPAPAIEPFRTLPDLLGLAAEPNIRVKLTATPALSHEPFPFRDIWPAARSVIGAFGPDRVMWGTDYNRTKTLHSYNEGVGYLREIDGLDETALRKLYGGTLARLLRWPTIPAAAPGAAS